MQREDCKSGAKVKARVRGKGENEKSLPVLSSPPLQDDMSSYQQSTTMTGTMHIPHMTRTTFRDAGMDQLSLIMYKLDII